MTSQRSFTVPVRAPYRLDLTATALRRLSTNVVDIFAGGRYRRAFANGPRRASLSVQQRGGNVEVEVRGTQALVEPSTWEPLVRRMLGCDIDLAAFYSAARAVPWLDQLVKRMRGVRPPRYPSLWEAIVNAVVYQQVSIHAASAILRRVIEHCSTAQVVDGHRLYAFPEPAAIVAADAAALRSAGLSVNKARALHGLGQALLAGDLDETELEPLDTPALLARLTVFHGIGPWTAAVIALRGFGRLDVFPLNDSGVARALRELAGETHVDPNRLLDLLGAQRGMLYYHLLLGRLAARGELDTTANTVNSL